MDTHYTAFELAQGRGDKVTDPEPQMIVSPQEEPKLSADEIIRAWRKGQISAHLRDGMLRAEGYELNKDQTEEAEEDES